MKHKLKQFIALIGTAILGNHPTMGSEALIEKTPLENPLPSQNDSFLSKLGTPKTTRSRTTRDNGNTLSFYRKNYKVDEGNYYGVPITVVRNGCSSNSSPVSVSYTTSNGTATEDDYQPMSGTLTWSTADATGNCGARDFFVHPNDDSEIEGNETVQLKLTDPIGAQLDRSEATLTIADNDGSVIGFAQDNFRVNEKEPSATITLERSNCNDAITSASVWYEISDTGNTATAKKDYKGITRQQLHWAEGDCEQKSFEIPLINDAEAEGDEIVNLKLTSSNQAGIGQREAKLTILDDDANETASGGVRFLRENYRVNEGEYFGLEITVIRTDCGPNNPPVSVSYSTSNGTATEEDYNSVSGTLAWSTADATGNCGARGFYVHPVEDTEVEGNETVILKLTDPSSGGQLIQNQATLTIIDNDNETNTASEPKPKPNDSPEVEEVVDTNVPSLSFYRENYQVDEEAETVHITVRHSNCQADTPTVSVNYATIGKGSATSDEDYSPVKGTLTLRGGTTDSSGDVYCGYDSFDIPILDDFMLEDDETFQLQLSNPSENARLAQSKAVVTIIDNELPSIGHAIIVAGVTRSEDSLFPYSHEYTQRLSHLLIERGFGEQDIHLLNLQQLIEDKVAPTQALSDAFDQAAQNLKAGQQFVFYWHGHAQPEHLLQGDSSLSAFHLSHLLNEIPTEVQQVIIIDSCYSGSFLNELSGVSNRIILTSTNDFNNTWKMRDGRSFSDHLIRAVRGGETLGNAFLSVRDMITADPKWFINQDPWLDDNSDGQYTHEDGTLAVETYLGREGIHAAPPPEIVEVHSPLSLTGETATATLWVKVIPNRPEAINQVRALLLKPDLPLNAYQGEGSDFARPTQALRYNGAQERYEGDYDYFCTGGEWRISYQAQSEEGIWSDLQFGELQQAQDIQAPLCLVPVTATINLNQTRYTAGDTLRLDLTVNGQGKADLYTAIVFPDNSFITIAYPDKLSFLNTAQAYLSEMNIDGKRVYSILNLELPASWALGTYSVCGVLMPPKTTEVLNQDNWIHWDCVQFEVKSQNSDSATNSDSGTHLPAFEAEKPNSNAITEFSTFRDTLQDGSLGQEMIVIPAGTFRMGDIQGGGGAWSDEKPVHEVSVARFAIGRYEVTHAEFVHFLNTIKRRGPEGEPWFATKAESYLNYSHIMGSTGNFTVEAGYENHPVTHVSWYGATAYLNWLTEQTGRVYRLPSEAQWEYAARAGTETKYWWGNDFGTNRANCSTSLGETAPVGSFEANPFGLYDTVGNVWEWCADPYHSNYQGAPTDGRIWEKPPENIRRLVRGGSFNFIPDNCRVAFRYSYSSDFLY
ncbi:MAG: SUMF1/EgtB/PvdO family nonheme iron enzyme, partial [Candidatus Parabeggiatoa sp.]|nr:SUMF1/EgtB/PvdO family nonheme iron enzyme [Candidatus Parabeggiatoa sp.]